MAPIERHPVLAGRNPTGTDGPEQPSSLVAKFVQSRMSPLRDSVRALYWKPYPGVLLLSHRAPGDIKFDADHWAAHTRRTGQDETYLESASSNSLCFRASEYLK